MIEGLRIPSSHQKGNDNRIISDLLRAPKNGISEEVSIITLCNFCSDFDAKKIQPLFKVILVTPVCSRNDDSTEAPTSTNDTTPFAGQNNLYACGNKMKTCSLMLFSRQIEVVTIAEPLLVPQRRPISASCL